MSPQIGDALSTIAAFLAAQRELEQPLRATWHAGTRVSGGVPAEMAAAAELLAGSLPSLTQAENGTAALGELLAQPGGEILLLWCSAGGWRRAAQRAPLLTMAAAQPRPALRAPAVAGGRVVAGPLRDALLWAPLLGDGAELAKPSNMEARARMEILLWRPVPAPS